MRRINNHPIFVYIAEDVPCHEQKCPGRSFTWSQRNCDLNGKCAVGRQWRRCTHSRHFRASPKDCHHHVVIPRPKGRQQTCETVISSEGWLRRNATHTPYKKEPKHDVCADYEHIKRIASCTTPEAAVFCTGPRATDVCGFVSMKTLSPFGQRIRLPNLWREWVHAISIWWFECTSDALPTMQFGS